MEQLKYYEIEFIKSQIFSDAQRYCGINRVLEKGLCINKPWSEQALEIKGLWTRSIILSEVYNELDLGKAEVKKILKSLEGKGILEFSEDFDGMSIFIREDNFTKLQKFKKDLTTD